MRFTGGTASYRVDFTSVDALQVRDRVQVRGIRMGEVSGMEILQASVRAPWSFVRNTDHRYAVKVWAEAVRHVDKAVRLEAIALIGEYPGTPASREAAQPLLGGSGGMLPREIFRVLRFKIANLCILSLK